MDKQLVHVSLAALGGLMTAITERIQLGRDDPTTGEFIEFSDDELDASLLRAAIETMTSALWQDRESPQ